MAREGARHQRLLFRRAQLQPHLGAAVRRRRGGDAGFYPPHGGGTGPARHLRERRGAEYGAKRARQGQAGGPHRGERQRILAGIPLGRLAEPRVLATVIAFLASDDAGYDNGVSLDVNGGSYMA